MFRYSLITPSRGDRPLALGQAIDSVRAAAENAGLLPDSVEMLVGFDGVRGERVRDYPFVRWYDFPANHDFGNAIRNGLLRASKGERILFLDDDNALTPEAFRIYERHPDIEFLVCRVDVSRAHGIPFLPREEPDRDPVRQANIDPLCLCLSRDLVVTRCEGWQDSGYEADFLNIVRYRRRARSFFNTPELVGIYDAGAGIDTGGLNFRHEKKDGKP